MAGTTTSIGVDKPQDRINGKPLQLISYEEKVADDFQWAKDTAKYFIDQAVFNRIGKEQEGIPSLTTKKALYDAYNGTLPERLFDYVTNPLNSSKPEYKKFPAKIRNYNILRPSIDLLIGEWNKRGFKFDVVNADGDDVFNSFLFAKETAYKKNVEQRVVQTLTKELGLKTPEEVQNLPSPATLITSLNLNYKDTKALQGYKALKILELELKLPEEWRRLFKDWTIAGETYTYKFPHLGEIEYGRVSPTWIDYDKSSLSPYIEDGDWAVVLFRLTRSEVMDWFYPDLTKDEIIEHVEGGVNQNSYHKSFSSLLDITGLEDGQDKLDVYYVNYKSKKQIGFLTHYDPFTGEQLLDVVDETYKVDKEAGEAIEWKWVNESWDTWRIGNDNGKYVRMHPTIGQRNEMNNFSKCKLAINGKRFSDTETLNTSVLALGLPYQIMYIIMMYRIELTIARSKGKIVLLDQNVIDDEDGEEHFIYYAEGMGWALINRDQEGVDKTLNQYHVLDLSLYADIKELIGIAEWIKGQWDELLGITSQRKGQGNSSDGLGVTQAKIFRSSVISDVIFTGFEEFLETEVQGLVDLTKYAWVDGKRGYYKNDDGMLEFLNIDGEEYSSTQYDVFAINASKEQDKFNSLKDQVNAIAQRKDVKTSTIIDLIWTESITELSAKVKRAEAIEAESIRKQAESQDEAAKELEHLRREYEVFLHKLDVDKLNVEWDRRDNNEFVKASLDDKVEAPIDPTNFGDIEKLSMERLDRMEKNRIASDANSIKNRDIDVKREKIASDERIAREKNKTALKNKVVGER